MDRLPGWQENLAQEFTQAHGRLFRWGEHDCCLFVARCYKAITGDDILRHFVKYSCESEALGIIWALGGMKGLLMYAFGEPKHPSRASQGDVVLIDMGRGEQPAVCMGLYSFAPGARKLEWRPTLNAVAAWTI